MSVVTQAAENLEAALKTVPDLRVYRDLSATVDPPAAVVGVPRLTWEKYCDGPSSATFLIYVFVPFDDRAVERLWELAIDAANAIDTVRQAVVTEASPGVFKSGGVDLPVYELTTEYAL